MADSAVVIMTTVPGSEEAARLAALLLEERLAACVQELPITSTYRWEGEVCRGPEVLLLVKTTPGRSASAASRIAAAHPYSVPEILVLGAAGGSGPYLDWLAAETGPGEA